MPRPPVPAVAFVPAVALVLAFAASLAATAALAHDYTLGDLHIEHPWARATAPGAPVAGAYLAIDNRGGAGDRLLRASSPAAREVQVHEMKMDGGVMKMREVAGGLVIPAKAKVTLQPAGYHLMLLGLDKPLAAGTRVPLKLTFERAGTLDVEIAVEAMGAAAPAGDMKAMPH